VRPLCFLDCETTSLGPDRRPWEIAVIRRDESGVRERSWIIRAEDCDLGNADLTALNVGRFYERHPGFTGMGSAVSELQALTEAERYLRGAVAAGSNPSFDTETLDRRMRVNGIMPSRWYRPKDVIDMAEGWLLGRDGAVPASGKSDDISRAVGVDPDEYDRHTALGDCRWTAAIYNVLTGFNDRPLF